MHKLQMVDLNGQYLKIKEEIDNAIQSVIDSSAFINGPKVSEFAQNLTSYLGGCNVVPCANGTDALQIALMALDLQPGDEIIIPAHTYIATAEVIALLRLKPVYVDVEPNYFNIDVDKIEEKITSRTKAIIPVHLYGQCADMEPILAIANRYNLFVIEDNAQAIGATYTFSDGLVKHAGTMGHIGTTSFFPSKNLGCYGDGGALFIPDDNLAKKCKMIANHGQTMKYQHELVGCNSRLDSVQAAVLDVKLKYLDKYSDARQKVAEIYNRYLKDNDHILIPEVADYTTHVYHQYTIKVDSSINRDDLQLFLKSKGIPSMIYYPKPTYLQNAYADYLKDPKEYPVTEALSRSVLSLPMHTELTIENQKFILSAIKEFIK